MGLDAEASTAGSSHVFRRKLLVLLHENSPGLEAFQAKTPSGERCRKKSGLAREMDHLVRE
jgi:hypothetical protein